MTLLEMSQRVGYALRPATKQEIDWLRGSVAAKIHPITGNVFGTSIAMQALAYQSGDCVAAAALYA